MSTTPDDGPKFKTMLSIDNPSSGEIKVIKVKNAVAHWLIQYYPDNREPHGSVCCCEVGASHDIDGRPLTISQAWERVED